MNEFNEEQYSTMRTAFLTAFPKIFTDIQYSTDIFVNMKKLAIDKGFSFTPNLFNNQMAIEIEARHKALNAALKEIISPNDLVIEIAAGLSPRHLEFKEYNYFEVDFAPVMDIKKEIYQNMGYKQLRNSLFSVDLSNITNLHDFFSTKVDLNKYQKIIILNEGLFWYLTKEKIALMTNEFSASLKNWIWLTSDCPTKDKIEDDYRKVISDSAKAKRGTFADYLDFTNFFKSLGLNNTKHKLSDYLNYDNLTSAQLFSIDQDEAVRRINRYTDISILKPF